MVWHLFKKELGGGVGGEILKSLCMACRERRKGHLNLERVKKKNREIQLRGDFTRESRDDFVEGI